MMKPNSALKPISRLLLSSIFVSSGIDKLMHREKTTQYMASKNVPAIPLALVAAAVTETVFGLALLSGRRQRMAATMLSSFLVPTSLIFHDFWNSKDETERQMQLIHFMKNVAIMGGLMHLASTEESALVSRTQTGPIGYIEINQNDADDSRVAS